MYNHAPKDYICPFCAFVQKVPSEDPTVDQKFVVFRNEFATAFISSHWWPNNPGHVLVVPNEHVENLYDIPEDLLGEVYAVAKRIACAFKEAYKADGTSTRQHNEPAGNQKVWHLHVHVFPRYHNDNLYSNHRFKELADPVKRAKYAEKLRKYFERKEIL